MTHAIKTLSATEQELALTLEPSEYQPKLDESYKAAQANLQIKGFRKGKVPMEMVKRLVGKEIESDAVEALASDMFSKIVAEKKLKLVGRARIRRFEFNPDKTLNVYLVYEVQPDFELKPFADYSFKKAEYEIRAEDVEREVKAMLEEQGVWVSKDGEATEEDMVIADSQQLDSSGTPIIGKRFENQEFLIRMIRKESPLRAALIGAKSGDERVVEIEARDEKGRGETRKYKLFVKEVKRLDLPELTDELAKEITQGRAQTAAELRASIENALKERYAQKAEEDLLEEIAKKFVEDNPIEAPSAMIRSFEDMLIENAARRLGGKFPKGFDAQAFRRQISPNAKRQAQWTLIRYKLAEMAGIRIDENAVRELAEADAKEMGLENADQVLQAYLKEEMQSYVVDRILREKVFAYLKSNLKITTEPKRISDEPIGEESM
ncbi:MAG: trigger factor [Chloroherpetonaceae bacterium]|nr:trigger factor [Chloroherpetonaceae bacterium]MDW8437004.1 trigger factor [Chloroherpetonaceae bacterium]